MESKVVPAGSKSLVDLESFVPSIELARSVQ
jgi:hypothetical protein